MQHMGARPWRRPHSGAWRRHHPGSQLANGDARGDDRTLRSRLIDKIRDRLMLRQQFLDQALERLDALEETGGLRVRGASFYTPGGLARGVGRREREAMEHDAERQRARERHRRERDGRREQAQMPGQSERERREYARESRDRDVTRDREEAGQQYDVEAANPIRETDGASPTPARSLGTSKPRSTGSKASKKARRRGTARRRS